jgi:hypothetical protein
LGEELHRDVWQGLVLTVDQQNLQQDVVVVHLY